MATPKGTATRTLILEHSKRIIAKDGFQAASFQKIAQACSIQQPAIFHYFKTKDDLLQAILDDLIIHSHQVVSEFTDEALDARQKILSHFEGTLKWALEFRSESSIFGLVNYYSSFHPEFREKYLVILSRARFRIQSILHEALHQGFLKDEVDIKLASALLHDVLLGGISSTIASGCTDSEVRLVKSRWKFFIDRFFLEDPSNATKAKSANRRR